MNKKEPKVSVIMSVYNEKIEWIEKAINSILIQTMNDFEFVIINDNPDNNEIKKYLNNIDDSRVKILENEFNVGLVESLNKGIEIAQGKYIARMDADDIAYKERFEKQVKYLDLNESVALLGGRVDRIDENGDKLSNGDIVLIGKNKIRKYMKYYNVVIHPTFMIRAQVLKSEKINKYRKIPLVEDYDLVCRILNAGYDVENLEDYVMACRVRTNGISKTNEFNQFKLHLLISEAYKNNTLFNIDSNLVKKALTDNSDLKNYNLINELKQNVNGKIGKINFYLTAIFKSKYYKKRLFYYFLVKSATK